MLAVTNRAYGGLSFPGGKANEGEDIRRVAIREMREETGVILIGADLTLVAKGDSARPSSTVEVHLFFARHAFGAPRDIEEGTVHRWVTFPELLDLSPFREFYERYLPDGVEHLAPTLFAPEILAP